MCRAPAGKHCVLKLRLYLNDAPLTRQYIGASVVIAGIIVTLIPTFFGHPTTNDELDATTQIVWSIVQVTHGTLGMCHILLWGVGPGRLDVD